MEHFQIKKILIPIDFSETGMLALEHASFMARLLKADIYLLHVIKIQETVFNVSQPDVDTRGLINAEATVVDELNKLALKLKKEYGFTVNVLYSKGNIASEIVAAVTSNDIDLVMMGTHGTSGFNEYFVGSNAHKTVSLCPCPVISVQTHSKKIGFGSIVLPIDDSLHSRQKVDYGIALAKKYGSRLHILGLMDKNGDTDPKKFQIKIDAVERMLVKEGVVYDVKIEKDNNMAAAALNYSKQVNADLIIVLTGHESNITGIFLGPFAKQIVNHSTIPVMSIRPIEGNYESVSLSAASPF